MTRRDLLSRLGIAGLVAVLPSWLGGPRPIRYWLTYGHKWEAISERWEDGSRVVVAGYDTPEEADQRMRDWLKQETKRGYPQWAPYRKEPMPQRLMVDGGYNGSWIMAEPFP